MEFIAILLFIAAFAVINKFCGGTFERPFGPLPDLPGRPIWYAGLLLLVALPLMYGWAGLAVAAAFITYREPGWRLWFKAELDWSRVDRPRMRMFARSLFAFPLLFIGAWWQLLLFAGLAVLAYEIGNWAQSRWPTNIMVMLWAEPLAGAAFGLCAALALT